MRSKTLFIGNILATAYAGFLLWHFGGLIAESGGLEAVEAVIASFGILFTLFGELLGSSALLNLISAFAVLLCIHVAFFTLGALFGWIAFLRAKFRGARMAATMYWLGTLCFPLYLLLGLPIAIVGSVGSRKQKRICRATAD